MASQSCALYLAANLKRCRAAAGLSQEGSASAPNSIAPRLGCWSAALACRGSTR